jgi:hypothetical protein
MLKPRRAVLVLGAIALGVMSVSPPRADEGTVAVARTWPDITPEMKPWTRWWWQGSAVEPGELTRQLTVLRDAGIGGVEITPIYGVRGTEDRFIPYLSAQWVRMLEHTLTQAAALNMGVDMATGTGWPFGGPWVDDRTAPVALVHREWTVGGGQRLNEPVRLEQRALVRALGNQIHVVSEGQPGDPRPDAAQPALRAGVSALRIDDLVTPVSANKNLQALALEQVKYPRDLPLIALVAYGEGGKAIDLTAQVGADRRLDWTSPPGQWNIHALFAGSHGKLVERAAPGGEGYVIDHFSRDAIRSYLAPFDQSLAGHRLTGLRAFFNDSYEVDDATGQADWTGLLLQEFQKRRGYDLRSHLPALLGRDSDERNARVLTDYRETISDLLLDTFTTEWSAWAHRRKALIRNQAHGSPGSLLDLYALSDIPETEGTEIERFKWATSAAHVAGRRLASAEAATWLGEHFRSTLADVRAAVDRFFVAGVNHIVYHGTAYSPASEPWPGWLFYAAVEFTPQNAWWDDFRALNQYVARVQSFLQSGASDHDVLLYFPLHDALAVRGNALLTHFGGANPPAEGTAFEAAAQTMQRMGFTYDYISDRQLALTRVDRGRFVTPGKAAYRALVIPSSRFLPVGTLERVLAFARDGGTVLSFKGFAPDVPGLARLEARRARLQQALASVRFADPDQEGISQVRLGRGSVVRGDDLPRMLARAGIARETMVDRGLAFARRADASGRIYFVSNPRNAPVEGWIPLASPGKIPAFVAAFDPMTGRSGHAAMRRVAGSEATLEVRLQIAPGGAVILETSTDAAPASYDTYRATGSAEEIRSPWQVRFVKGGPSLPGARSVDRLASWTTFGGSDAAELQRFSGTAAYTTTFPRPQAKAEAWQLDLGVVHESARVRLNGRDVATLISSPYRLVLPADALGESNALEVAVTNLSANRIADLDRRGVVWKKFYNVNYPPRSAENRGPDGLFSAARWTPLDSGLLGPVTVTPLARE